MKIYDISMTIHPEMPVYKNKAEKRPVLTFISDFTTTNSCESRIQMDMHTGTHVDAPLHMLPGGGTIENIDLRKVVTCCKVLDLTGAAEKITRSDLAVKDIEPGDFVLMKTRNSFVDRFDFEFVYLDKDGAAYLRDRGVAGVGIDALGIERNQPGHDSHKILFAAGIIVLEGLRLGEVEEGRYFLCALPLKIQGAESAPARAVLVE
ncbi:cyclase family protein [Desulfoscipio geothermicus]|jgi:arylformamidase|uniref:Kynurenine formamidase n=1 Tax=Desulfoscipio geothermicus DSM 3669 TaxID=1121426 RepID=A0A1I6CNR5_9FIRM|nr:cyclase family protein [Desulfoscipio geothermicus]SFQ94798.1 Kynurenine formamidase [Desulfoscipio geothermicus DSM 3669]